MRHEPGRLEMLLTRLAFLICGRSVYKAFADRIPIAGGERVLDFGCGMGTVAYHVAKRLPRGCLTCMDISERWLNACRKTLKRHGNIIFLKWEPSLLAAESFDIVYCHFVLHDIPQGELEIVIPALARALKPGGVLVFREPLDKTEKISAIRSLMRQNSLIHKDSRVTDVPIMGNALEGIYIKNNGGLPCFM